MRQLFLIIIFLSSTVYSVNCPNAEVAAKAVRTTRAELLKAEVGSEGMDTSVSTDVQGQVSVFKDRLVQLADAVLACTSTTQATIGSIQKSLSDQLGPREPDALKEAPKGVDEAVAGIFGTDATAIVSAPRQGFMFVELSFGVTCGSDSVLLLYQATNHSWKRVVRWQSQPYDKVNGAFGDFFHYGLINDAKTNELAVVAAHGHPWCTSRWSAFDIDVLSLESGSVAQKQILHQELGYVRDEATRWKTLRNGFELRANDAFLDLAVMTKRTIFKFELVAGVLQRVQPIAMNGIGFVDEWLQSEWSNAQKWTDGADQQHFEELRNVHESVRKRLDDTSRAEFGYGPVRHCAEINEYEAQIEMNDKPRYFIRIKQGPNGFTMLSASDIQKCSGLNFSAVQ